MISWTVRVLKRETGLNLEDVVISIPSQIILTQIINLS